MSKETAKAIVDRAKKDEAFMLAILENADKILQDYELSDVERRFFREADRKSIEGLKDSCFELVK